MLSYYPQQCSNIPACCSDRQCFSNKPQFRSVLWNSPFVAAYSKCTYFVAQRGITQKREPWRSQRNVLLGACASRPTSPSTCSQVVTHSQTSLLCSGVRYIYIQHFRSHEFCNYETWDSQQSENLSNDNSPLYSQCPIVTGSAPSWITSDLSHNATLSTWRWRQQGRSRRPCVHQTRKIAASPNILQMSMEYQIFVVIQCLLYAHV
jgi:hypothetical protein